MQMRVRIEMVEDGNTVAAVDHAEELPDTSGFFTDDAFGLLVKEGAGILLQASKTFSYQLARERFVAKHADEWVPGSLAAPVEGYPAGTDCWFYVVPGRDNLVTILLGESETESHEVDATFVTARIVEAA